MSQNYTDQQKTDLLSKILNFIAFKPRTTQEVTSKLQKLLKTDPQHKDYDSFTNEELLNEIIEYLKEEKYLNDIDYAAQYVSVQLTKRKPPSLRKMQEFLYKKGVSADIISNAFADISPRFEQDAVQRLAEKKSTQLGEMALSKKRAKLLAYLTQKGYSFEVCYTVVDRLLGVK